MDTQHRKSSDLWDGGCMERDLGRCRRTKGHHRRPSYQSDQGHTKRKMKERGSEGSLFPPHQQQSTVWLCKPLSNYELNRWQNECGTDKWVNRKKSDKSNNQPPWQCLQGLTQKMMTQTLCVNWDYSKTCKHSEIIMPTSILKKQKNTLLTKEFQPLRNILLSNVTKWVMQIIKLILKWENI